jgi:hypothetical protein
LTNGEGHANVFWVSFVPNLGQRHSRVVESAKTTLLGKVTRSNIHFKQSESQLILLLEIKLVGQKQLGSKK